MVTCKLCYTWKLKERIQHIYGQSISFIPRPGLSDLVCSNQLTVGIALMKRAELHRQYAVNPDEEYDDSIDSLQENDDKQILHRAAGILLINVESVKGDRSNYLSVT
ncbi:hypothetical protein SNE40_018308 [Patella caerulea]|uniref:Uncharacterized protein n=1 Tax=Patella caerulea TaxID=87958 RepID=A0AAN8PKK5_PATCE